MSKRVIVPTVIVAGIGIILLMAINLYFRQASQVSVPIEADFFQPTLNVETAFTGAIYAGPALSLPRMLPVLQIEAKPLPNYTDTLGKTCRINEVSEEVFRGATCSYSLSEDYSQAYLYATDPTYSYQVIDLLQAEAAAETFLTQFYPNPSLLTYLPKENIYLRGDLEPSTVEPEQANLVALSYAFESGGVPILTKDSYYCDINLIVDAGGQVLTADLSLFELEATPRGSAQMLLSPVEAASRITSDESYIIAIAPAAKESDEEEVVGPNIDIKTLSSIIFTQARLEYRLNDAKDLAIPAFHFTGTALDRHQNSMVVDIITPAINFTLAAS